MAPPAPGVVHHREYDTIPHRHRNDATVHGAANAGDEMICLFHRHTASAQSAKDSRRLGDEADTGICP